MKDKMYLREIVIKVGWGDDRLVDMVAEGIQREIKIKLGHDATIRKLKPIDLPEEFKALRKKANKK